MRSTFGRETDPRRVLVVAHGVDHLHARKIAGSFQSGERAFDRVDLHAVVIGFDRNHPRPEPAERSKVSEIGRRGGEDDVTRVEQNFADERQQLLRTGREDQLLGVDAEAASRAAFELCQMRHEVITKALGPLRRPVLQGLFRDGFVCQQNGRCRSAFGDRKRLLIDEPGGERNHVRILDGLFHQEPDRLPAPPFPALTETDGREIGRRRRHGCTFRGEMTNVKVRTTKKRRRPRPVRFEIRALCDPSLGEYTYAA